MLEVRSLGFIGPDPDRPLLQNLAFSLDAGEALAITGPESCGKSVLLRILSGAIREYSGEVLFEGTELRAWSRDYFERTGAVLDPPGLFRRLSVRENAESHARLYRNTEGTVDGWLEGCGLAGLAATRAAKLTRDQELLAGLARAQVHGPRLLCIDSPAEGLAPETAERVAAAIRLRTSASKTTVLAARPADWAAGCCGRILRLGAGGAAA